MRAQLRKFLREIAYIVPAALAVAALLSAGFGFGGTWVNVVSLMAGMVLGRMIEGGVALFRAYRAGARPPGDPGAVTPGRSGP